MTLGRIEYLEPLLIWFYLSIAISFHCPSLFLPVLKFLVGGGWWKRLSVLFSELGFDADA
jgi:hypothetical protein